MGCVVPVDCDDSVHGNFGNVRWASAHHRRRSTVHTQDDLQAAVLFIGIDPITQFQMEADPNGDCDRKITEPTPRRRGVFR